MNAWSLIMILTCQDQQETSIMNIHLELAIKTIDWTYFLHHWRLKAEGSAIERKFGNDYGDVTLKASVFSASADLGLDEDDNFNAMGKAALLRYGEVQAGPVSVNNGITFDTGIKAGKDGVGAYFGELVLL